MFRRLGLALVAVVGLGCFPQQPAPAVTSVHAVTVVTGLDFSRYTQRGFLFTTEMYQGPYESVGLITATRYAAAVLDSTIDSSYYLPRPEGRHFWRYETLHIEEVLDTIYARATALKADAVVKFTATEVEGGPPANVPGLRVSGFAIRRLDKH